MWAIALHAGAGNIRRDLPAEEIEHHKAGLLTALDVGIEILAAKGTSLDAVEATTIALEDNPLFNAGRGSVFNLAGEHQLDASIMNGADLSCGAVAGLQRTRNPIRTARMLMEQTDHVLLAGPQADEFGIARGLDEVSLDYFYSDRAWREYLKYMKKSGQRPLDSPAYVFPESANFRSGTELESSGETVGCVALDDSGHLAAATSTGGASGSMAGRVGDSPIVCAGNYADDRSIAISGTGRGEEYIRHTIAFRFAFLVGELGMTIQEAGAKCLHEILPKNVGGMIAVDHSGNFYLDYNTGSMSRAWATSASERNAAIWKDPI